ncbi:energy transducer TonB [Methylocystis heyeri]|uniref:Energy transducer TonB n=1 Tax=Methylocystis heyeri TaxID=391905 RepID=A0A6B8KIW2_9HYPH|nr:energy transducer TonB [Methylocystis heyeri]QGM46835.1 energy transducer TonB [Methylocystis heyeri]
MRRAAALAIFAVVNSAAIAEQANSPAPTPAAPAVQAKPLPKAETPSGGVQAKPQPASAPNAAAPAVLSQSKFLGMLYAEIAKRTPAENTVGKGDVAASFHVNGQGKVDKVVIEKTSSPAHAELVKKILAAVQAPQPPGGGADISQNFKFH